MEHAEVWPKSIHDVLVLAGLPYQVEPVVVQTVDELVPHGVPMRVPMLEDPVHQYESVATPAAWSVLLNLGVLEKMVESELAMTTPVGPYT